MLHGMMLDRHLFEPQIEGLSARFRVVAPDLRSRWGDPSSVTLDRLAADVVELLDHLELQDPVLVGMSLGGYVAQRTTLWHPERVRGLVLIGADVAAGPDPESERVFATQRHLPTVDPAFARAEAEAHFAQRTREGRPDLVEEWVSTFAGRGGAETWTETLCWSRLEDLSSELHSLGKPMLALWGAEDVCVSPERGRRTASAWPGARFVCVPNAGHAVNVEQPAVVNTEIALFADALRTREEGREKGMEDDHG